MRIINSDSIILPYLIDLKIPGFSKENIGTKTLSYTNCDSYKLFDDFLDKIFSKIGKEYLPIIRLSDGEYIFLVGLRPPLFDGRFFTYIKKYLIYLYNLNTKFKSGFQANTLTNVSSGVYSWEEADIIRQIAIKDLLDISKKGIIAMHLTYAKSKSFQENYHRPVYNLFCYNGIFLNHNNYYPFYFVYALLMGDNRKKLFFNNRICLINSATGFKKNSITKYFESEKVKDLFWINISKTKSFNDQIDVSHLIGKVDLVLIGAGVGKMNIFKQVEKLNVPCIDAGFCFEVWHDKTNAIRRSMMSPDLVPFHEK